MILYCSEARVAETIAFLRHGGAQGVETVVLWLSTASLEGDAEVTQVLCPEQRVAADQFYISSASMRDIMKQLRRSRSRIVAQIHSHPREAFHSKADDEWAIIRRVGALSLVLPNFARATTIENFLTQAAIFRLSPENKWEQVAAHSFLKVTHA